MSFIIETYMLLACRHYLHILYVRNWELGFAFLKFSVMMCFCGLLSVLWCLQRWKFISVVPVMGTVVCSKLLRALCSTRNGLLLLVEYREEDLACNNIVFQQSWEVLRKNSGRSPVNISKCGKQPLKWFIVCVYEWQAADAELSFDVS